MFTRKIESSQIDQNSINVTINDSIAKKSTTIDGGMRKLQVFIDGKCNSYEHRFILTDYESKDIPVYKADVYFINGKSPKGDFLVNHLTTTDKKGGFCLKRKHLKGDGIIISLIGHYQLHVNLK